MATKQQKIFARIVLHNKLLDQAQLEQLLEQMPDPEVIAKYLLKSGKLPEKKVAQLLALYHKQLEKQVKPTKAKSRSTPEHAEASAGDASAGEARDGEARDGDARDGEARDGDARDGDTSDGDTSDGDTSDGDTSDGDTSDGDTSDGDTSDGDTSDGDASDGDANRQASVDEGAGYGGLPPIKIDLEGDDEEEDLPLLERDTDPEPARATSASGASGAGPVAVDPEAKERIHEILLEARQMKASDVHITAGLSPMVRLASKLKIMDRPVLSATETEGSLLALLDDGRRSEFLEHLDLDFCYDGGEQLGRFRTNFLTEQAGMDAVFRLIDTEVPNFEKLGLPEQIKRFTEYSQGMVLITGPKGSGKTTTLAAMVDLLNRTRQEHIIVIEDPIEFVHPNKMAHINQREVGTHTKSFGNAMRAALREAPDIIVVGEMRDLETTSLAISAAETGHLVLATLHTPDALRTIGRVLDVYPPKEQAQIRAMLSESLRGIVSQQLVPSTDGNSLELAVEILVNTSAIGNMIREDRTFQLRGMMQTGRKIGMVLLDDSLVRLVKEGRISKEEACLRATEEEYVLKELG
jgi:twitching motility protein PilT